MKRYNPSQIEPKWQNYWQDKEFFAAADLDSTRQKFYVAEMFPYPSGDGLHVGHVRNFTMVDVVARYKAQQGFNVMRPFGYDTFGLPAENYAIKTGNSPQNVTDTNIGNFRNQAQRLGFAIDWSRELNTSNPEYYKWTQWIFAQLYKKGLAYKKESYQWWCNFDKTVLANEQVEGGKCWRCGKEVEKKKMSQWYFKITEYADELLADLDKLDWPEKIKIMQRNWIGRSEGELIDFKIDGHDEVVRVFTTRPDTIFGATFMVLAPEHPSVVKITTDEQRTEVVKYQEETLKKSEIQRQENKTKTGVFTGAFALNPATNEKIPIWIADYVLPDYGEGAIMAVPAHDERDWEFAQKFDLPTRQVIAPVDSNKENPPRKDKKDTKRKVVNVIVKHPTEDKYLTNVHPKRGWHDFIMGGIEDGETADEAAVRELREETGYTNVELIEKMPLDINAVFYAPHKDVNRDIIMTTLLFQLKDFEQVEKQLDEVEQIEDCKLEWTAKDSLHKLYPVNGLDYIMKWLNGAEVVFTEDGTMMNSSQFDGLPSAEAREKISKWLEKKGVAQRKVQYKIRDWLISRQRYWGCPIPIAYDENGKTHLIPDDQLPVVLPQIDDYKPDDSGHSALAKDKDWLKVTIDGQAMVRETDTLDGYACSSWYLLRYADPHNSEQAWSKDLVNYWNPVDCYIGADHAVAHLLYVRFWCKVFADLGLVDFREPVKKLVYHGYINDEKNKKMSKSKGNVINPLDIIDSGYGADTLRTYEMFIAPYEMDAPWSTAGVGGVYRFLTRVWNLTQEFLDDPKELDSQAADELLHWQHKTIKKVTEDIERISFNTAVAALMEYLNAMTRGGTSQAALVDLAKLLMPFAPHIASELLEQLGQSPAADWPKWDEKYLKTDQVTIAVQVNGKLRGETVLPIDSAEAEVAKSALALENVKNFTDSQQIVKTIYVKNKIINFVVKSLQK
jgi:leucyl-tRNA synthetase